MLELLEFGICNCKASPTCNFAAVTYWDLGVLINKALSYQKLCKSFKKCCWTKYVCAWFVWLGLFCLTPSPFNQSLSLSLSLSIIYIFDTGKRHEVS